MACFKSVLALLVALVVALAAFAPEAEASFGLANSKLGRKLRTYSWCGSLSELRLHAAAGNVAHVAVYLHRAWHFASPELICLNL
jgi:hypothetical protein